MNKTLIYVHDPMCSWCWGFEPVRKQLFEMLPEDIEIQRLVGGLAPDSMDPMPTEMQNFLQETWKKIEQQIPGTKFNHDFWRQCSPRRSTYPANRAVIAARLQGEQYDQAISLKIQQAYYLQARNPSDDSTLVELAAELGLNTNQFERDLSSETVEKILQQEIFKCRRLGMNSFPSLAIQTDEFFSKIDLDYQSAEKMYSQIYESSFS